MDVVGSLGVGSLLTYPCTHPYNRTTDHNLLVFKRQTDGPDKVRKRELGAPTYLSYIYHTQALKPTTTKPPNTNQLSQGRLSLLQNIDVYNTSASRVLPSTLAVAPDGKNVYVVGDNFAISTSAILVYR